VATANVQIDIMMSIEAQKPVFGPLMPKLGPHSEKQAGDNPGHPPCISVNAARTLTKLISTSTTVTE
jgi:hypothetical protein